MACILRAELPGFGWTDLILDTCGIGLEIWSFGVFLDPFPWILIFVDLGARMFER